MKAIRVLPKQKPEVIEFDGTLESIQAEVGGYATEIKLKYDGTLSMLVQECDTQEQAAALPANRKVGAVGVLRGPILIVATDVVKGVNKSLTERDIARLVTAFSEEVVTSF
jgi:hypothetical protein